MSITVGQNSRLNEYIQLQSLHFKIMKQIGNINQKYCSLIGSFSLRSVYIVAIQNLLDDPSTISMILLLSG